jgi:hypothetical protein
VPSLCEETIMRGLKGIGIALAMTLASATQAQSLTARAGSNGLGAEIGVGLGSMVGLRANLLGGSISRDEVRSGVRYEGTLKLGNGSLLMDVHPFAGAFRLSAGAVFNNNRLDANGRADGGSIDINGVSYPSDAVGSLQAAVRWDRTNPYLGLGWGAAPPSSAGFFFSADLGAFYMRPTATLTGTCGTALPAAACTQLQADIRAEEQQFRDDVNKYKLYPVLSIGVGYRF